MLWTGINSTWIRTSYVYNFLYIFMYTIIYEIIRYLIKYSINISTRPTEHIVCSLSYQYENERFMQTCIYILKINWSVYTYIKYIKISIAHCPLWTMRKQMSYAYIHKRLLYIRLTYIFYIYRNFMYILYNISDLCIGMLQSQSPVTGFQVCM